MVPAPISGGGASATLSGNPQFARISKSARTVLRTAERNLKSITDRVNRGEDLPHEALVEVANMIGSGLGGVRYYRTPEQVPPDFQ